MKYVKAQVRIANDAGLDQTASLPDQTVLKKLSDLGLHHCLGRHLVSGRSRGGSVGSLEPPSLPPRFQISYENEIIWSQ